MGQLPDAEGAAGNRGTATCCGSRVSRMSGTSYGACILHVRAESIRRLATGRLADDRSIGAHGSLRRERLDMLVDRGANSPLRRAAWTSPRAPRFRARLGLMFQRQCGAGPIRAVTFDYSPAALGQAAGESRHFLRVLADNMIYQKRSPASRHPCDAAMTQTERLRRRKRPDH